MFKTGPRTLANRGGFGKCTACAHPRLALLDADLIAEVPYRQLTKRYGITRQSLMRHKAAHLGKEIVAVKKRPVRPTKETALARVEKLYDRLEALWETVAPGQVGVLLGVSDRLVRSLELLAKLSGELSERPQTVINLQSTQEWTHIRTIVVEFIPPERRQEFSQRLELLDGGA